MVARSVILRKGSSQQANVGGSKVQAFGAGGRDDMRRVSREKKFPVLHGLDHETAHSGDTFLNDRTFGKLPAVYDFEANVQFVPDHMVGPCIDIVIRRALNIKAGNLWRTHAQQGKAPLMVGIDEFVRRRRSFGENSQPRERIGSLVNLQNSVGN